MGNVSETAATSHRPFMKFNKVPDAIRETPKTRVLGATCLVHVHLRNNDSASDDFAAVQRLIGGVGFLQRKPLGDDLLGPERATRGQPDDLRHVRSGTGAVRADAPQDAAY